MQTAQPIQHRSQGNINNDGNNIEGQENPDPIQTGQDQGNIPTETNGNPLTSPKMNNSRRNYWRKISLNKTKEDQDQMPKEQDKRLIKTPEQH